MKRRKFLAIAAAAPLVFIPRMLPASEEVPTLIGFRSEDDHGKQILLSAYQYDSLQVTHVLAIPYRPLSLSRIQQLSALVGTRQTPDRIAELVHRA